MGKTTIIWCAEYLNGERKGNQVKRKTLKGLADEIGFPYSTAKTKKPEDERERRLWSIDGKAFEVWFEEVI